MFLFGKGYFIIDNEIFSISDNRILKTITSSSKHSIFALEVIEDGIVNGISSCIFKTRRNKKLKTINKYSEVYWEDTDEYQRIKKLVLEFETKLRTKKLLKIK